MTSDRTRYGDLTRQAGLHLTAAAEILTNEQFRSLPAASVALTAYGDLHDALYRLGWQLRGGTIAQVLVPDPARRDARETATLDLLEQVGRIATRSYAKRIPRAGVAGQWHRAAVQLRTANDLLATHRTPLGAPRTPDTPDLQDPAAVGSAWRDYASLVLAAASVAEPLAIRARTMGVTTSRARGLLWAGERLTHAAKQLRSVAGVDPPDPGTDVIDLEVANPTIRTGDPLLELGDRLAQMHTAAWSHTQRGTMTVPTLTDLAAAGVMLHAATHRTLTSAGVADPSTVNLIAAHGTAWRQAHTALDQLRSIDPVPGGIRQDAQAIRRLLHDVERDAHRVPLAEVLVDACRSHDRVAEWSATALYELSARGHVYLPGRTLTGDDISDNPELTAAKLTGALTTAPSHAVVAVLVHFANASSVSNVPAEFCHARAPRRERPTAEGRAWLDGCQRQPNLGSPHLSVGSWMVSPPQQR